MAKDFFTDSTERTAATLESDGMRVMGAETGNTNPVHTSYASVKAAVLAAVPSSSPDYILIRDVKTSGTDGGTFTAGADQTRDLTEITSDSGGHASLATNQITLAAGTYRFAFSAPAVRVDSHQAWLYNVSDATIPTGGVGTSQYSWAADIIANHSMGRGKFTIATSKTFELQHRCSTTNATEGFGKKASFTTPNKEVYSIVEFWKTA